MTLVDRPPAAPAEAPPAGAARTSRTGAVAVATRVAGAVTALVAVLAVALVVGGGTDLAAPGPLVEAGLPIARLAGRIAALGAVGALLFVAVLLPVHGPLPPASRRALRAASAWATAWAAATAVSALLTLSQLVGGSPDLASVRTFVLDLPAGRAAVVVLGCTVLLAAVARRCTRTVHAGALLLVAQAALVVPVVLTGHSAAADDHVLAVTNLSVHVVAAALWVGGLLALLAHGRGLTDLAPAAVRYSAVALGCFAAIGASGVLAGWLVAGRGVGAAALLGTGYGWLLLAKSAALLTLGLLGWQHRRRTIPRLRSGEPGSFRRFAFAELGVMLATVALAVALSSSPPPVATGAPAGAVGSAAPATAEEPPSASGADDGADAMAGHDHGELSVAVLIDESRFHVAGPVEPGSRVTVHNSTPTEVTISAADGSFDVVVPGFALMTFAAPDEPGSYPFTSRHSTTFSDVLVVE